MQLVQFLGAVKLCQYGALYRAFVSVGVRSFNTTCFTSFKYVIQHMSSIQPELIVRAPFSREKQFRKTISFVIRQVFKTVRMTAWKCSQGNGMERTIRGADCPGIDARFLVNFGLNSAYSSSLACLFEGKQKTVLS